MKTETQIAKENIREMKKIIQEGLEKGYMRAICKEHKASCQRDIPKLEKIKENVVYVENELTHHLIDEMINDKKQAIKLYKDNGI